MIMVDLKWRWKHKRSLWNVPIKSHAMDRMAVYETFTVLGSKISVNWMYEGYNGPSVIGIAGNLIQTVGNADNQPALTPMICGLHKGIETLASGTGEEQMEKDRTQWTFINGQHASKTTGSSLATSDFYGKGALVGAAGYTGSATADPTKSSSALSRSQGPALSHSCNATTSAPQRSTSCHTASR